jgi:hypothetical protein
MMKRGLLTLATVAIALLCSSVYAYAPIIIDIPDVLIGDAEDNPSSCVPDLNFFVFTDAFNFDNYVTCDSGDPDCATTYPQIVRWSFLETLVTGQVTINGIGTLADPSESIEPGAKELTSYPNTDPLPRASSLATFRDLVDSPLPDAVPYGDPTEATCLNTIITIYASNGSKADSEEIIVKANVDDSEICLPDMLSQGVPLICEKDWTSPATEGWVKSLALANGAYIGRFNDLTTPYYYGTHTTSGGNIRGSGSAQNVWCSWESTGTDVTYTANNVYRIQYLISSDQSDITKVPNCRLLTYFKGPGVGAMNGGNRVGQGLFPPDADGNLYNVYIGPPDLTAGGVTFLTVNFEVIDFSAAEAGTNSMEECHICRFETPDKTDGTLEKTITTWTGWSTVLIGSPVGNATLGSNTTGLYIQTAATPAQYHADWRIDYGGWTLGAGSSGQSFAADKLYRCVYTLKKANSADNIGKIRLINGNYLGDYNAKITLIPDQTQVHMPGTSDTEYSVWFETMPALYANPTYNQMSFLMDVSDGNVLQLGRLYLSKIELYSYDIP